MSRARSRKRYAKGGLTTPCFGAETRDEFFKREDGSAELDRAHVKRVDGKRFGERSVIFPGIAEIVEKVICATKRSKERLLICNSSALLLCA